MSSHEARSNSLTDRTARLFENINVVMETQRQRRNNNGHTVNPRDRLFHALFIKVGLVYSRLVPRKCRTLLEVIVLLQGISLFTLLSYLHFSFGRSPVNCLEGNSSWPKDGVLQLRIQHQISLKKAIPRFYSFKEQQVLFHPCHNGNINNARLCYHMADNLKKYYDYHNTLYNKTHQCYQMNLSDFLITQNLKHKKFQNYEYIVTDVDGEVLQGYQYGDIVEESKLLSFYEKYLAPNEEERQYVFEYAKEFGFLRLSPETRKRLNIPVKVVTLDPLREKCFGDIFSRLVWKYLLGYDEILMSSMKKIADMENNSGYMLNVVTGDHYKFVSWGIGRGSYFISLVLMFLFTVSISTLLRYCHQQVFFFIIRMLQMMDSNIVLAFPIAPLFTVVLSLVGMETIMSEYFNDTTTSFYIILIVWAVDQFDTICCHTTTSQKYWLRFFYLYHFIFYAYHYRFNGQYSSLALATTWFFIQHSMLYFFHNYELPAIENHIGNGRRDEETYLDEAVQIIVEGIEMVVGQQNSPAATNNANNEENEVRDPEPHNSPQRIFVFAIDRPIIQMFREFIRQFRERLSLQRLDENENGDGGIIIRENTENRANHEVNEEVRQADFVEDVILDTENIQITPTQENSVAYNGIASEMPASNDTTTNRNDVSSENRGADIVMSETQSAMECGTNESAMESETLESTVETITTQETLQYENKTEKSDICKSPSINAANSENQNITSGSPTTSNVLNDIEH